LQIYSEKDDERIKLKDNSDFLLWTQEVMSNASKPLTEAPINFKSFENFLNLVLLFDKPTRFETDNWAK
jgi:hypothetical protein